MTTGVATGDNGNGTVVRPLPVPAGEVSKTFFSELAEAADAMNDALTVALADPLDDVLALAAKSCSRPPPP